MKKLSIFIVLALATAALAIDVTAYLGDYQQTLRDKKPATGSLHVSSENGVLRIERASCVSTLPLNGSEGTYCWQKGDSGKGRLSNDGNTLIIKADFQSPGTPDFQGAHRVQITEQWKLSDDHKTLTIRVKGRITDLRTGVVINGDSEQVYERK